MAIRRILVDEGLLLELLFGRPLPLGQGDRLWELFQQGQVRGYVTDFALFPGRGFDPDVVLASIEAYLDALGYLIVCDRL